MVNQLKEFGAGNHLVNNYLNNPKQRQNTSKKWTT